MGMRRGVGAVFLDAGGGRAVIVSPTSGLFCAETGKSSWRRRGVEVGIGIEGVSFRYSEVSG